MGGSDTFAALLARIEQLEAEVRELRHDAHDVSASIGRVDRAAVSRRRLLGLAGAAAAGAVGAAVTGVAPAAATTGTWTFGQTSNDAGSAETGLTSTATTQTLSIHNTGTGSGILGTSTSTDGSDFAVKGSMTATSGATYGVHGTNASTTANAVAIRGDATGASGQTNGLLATNASTTDTAAAVRASADGATGATYGVYGSNGSTSAGAVAVFGEATASSGAVIGVKGTVASTTKDAAAVRGDATGASGQVFGVLGVNTNSTGGAGVCGSGASGIGLRGSSTSSAQLYLVPSSTTAGPPTSGSHNVGEFFVDSTGVLFQCVNSLSGTWVRQSPLVTLASPVRIYDSRSTGGPLALNEDRQLDARANSSGVPTTASAILVNLAIANTVGTGFLGLFKDGISYPGNANINWFGSGQILSNAATTAVANSAKFKVHCGGGSTHVIVDLIGYYP